MGTYFLTLCLLAGSFGCVYLLSLQQLKNRSNFYLAILISLSISIINSLIGFLIRFSTKYEKHYTETSYQTSLGVKSIFAQVLNTIVVPIVANYLI